MDDIADIWIFFAPNDSDFGNLLADRVRNDMKDKTVRTSDDLRKPSIHVKPQIRPKDVILIVIPERKATGWFIDEQVTALLSGTDNIVTIQYKPDIPVPGWLSKYQSYDFTDDIEFEVLYKTLFRKVTAMF